MMNTRLPPGRCKLKKTKLKPYVHKIKGAKNYALYDLLKGNFYTIIPEGDVEALKNALKEAGLTFETEGIVPFKTEIDMKAEKEIIQIRELQIRLNGRAEDNCRNRKKIDEEKRFITMDTLVILKEKLSRIPVKTIHIEAESHDREKIGYILKEYPYKEAMVVVGEGSSKEDQAYLKKICDNRDTAVTFLIDGKKDMKGLEVEIYDFFYSRHFNPCLGQKVAVDCGGEIKPCLWWKNSLGMIGKDNIRDMINMEIFDRYWKLTRDKIDVCKDAR